MKDCNLVNFTLSDQQSIKVKDGENFEIKCEDGETIPENIIKCENGRFVVASSGKPVKFKTCGKGWLFIWKKSKMYKHLFFIFKENGSFF